MIKCIFEQGILAVVSYVNLGIVQDGETLEKAAGMWKEDQKVIQ